MSGNTQGTSDSALTPVWSTPVFSYTVYIVENRDKYLFSLAIIYWTTYCTQGSKETDVYSRPGAQGGYQPICRAQQPRKHDLGRKPGKPRGNP